MTDVRAPEADPFESAAEQDDRRTRSPGRAGGGFGLADWLKWGWRQLTSMRIALVLLFLLALGSVPGSMLPQEGHGPGRRAAVLHVAPGTRAAAEPPRVVQRLRRALVRRHLPAAVRLPGGLRGAPDVPAGRLGPDAPAAGAAPPDQAAAIGRVHHRAGPGPGGRGGRERSWPATASGSAGPPTPASTGSRPRRGTCGRSATCCSTWPCSGCWSRSRWAGCSATRPTGCSCRGPRSPTPRPRWTSSTPAGSSPPLTSARSRSR